MADREGPFLKEDELRVMKIEFFRSKAPWELCQVQPRSRKDSEDPNPNHVLSPPVQTPVAAPSPFSSIQMSLHKEHETRIKILTAAFQKYKAKRDSKSFEEQLQKPDNDLLNLPSTFPSSPLPATAMIEKVEHYKGFYSEVQTEEHDLKVFDDMSLFLEEEVKMKIEAEEDVALDSSATENLIELTSSSIPTSMATNTVMSGRIDSTITVYENYAEEIVNEIPGWESASSFDEIQKSLNTSHSSTGEKQGTSQENDMSLGTTLPGEISSSNCKVIMVACTSRTLSPRQDLFDAAFPESHGSKFTSSPYANEQIQEAPTLQPSLVQVTLQLAPIPQENNFKFIEREMGSYIVSKRTMEIHPEDFHNLDFNLGDSNKPCFNLSKDISSLVGNTRNMRNLGISKSYQMKLWDPGTGNPIMCSHLSGKEYGLVTCTNDGIFWIWNPCIRATNMSVSMLKIIVLQAQGAMTHHFTILDFSVSSEPDRHQEATIFGTMNIRLPKRPSPFMQHTVARFEEYLTECCQWIEELEQLIRMDPDKISSSSGLALLQSLPNVMSNVYDIVVHVAAKVESLHEYVESTKTAYLADQRHHGDENDPFPESYRRETAKQEVAARRIHPSLHLLATSAQPSTQGAGLFANFLDESVRFHVLIWDPGSAIYIEEDAPTTLELQMCDKDHPTQISSNLRPVERYVLVHEHIILQQFAEYPDETTRKCAIDSCLSDKILQRHHTKLVMKKKVTVQKEANLNPSVAAATQAGPSTQEKMVITIWDPGISVISSLTLRQGQFKGEGVDACPIA